METSVVLICYNQENFILDALDGIRHQSVQPNEVVIADDCSIDKTQEIILKYVDDHSLSHWKLIFNPHNLGINLNLQNGIDHTTSDIIIPMSGDDISLPNRCEVAIKLFEKHPLCHIVSTSIYKVNEHKEVIGELSYKNELINDVKKVIISGMPNVFPIGQSWKRSVFDKFGKLPRELPNEDDQITFRALIDNGIFCSDIKTVMYRVHSKSASSWLRNNQDDQEYFNQVMDNMTVRRLHMEFWRESLQIITRKDKHDLLSLIELKINLYSFFREIESVNFFQRLMCLIKYNGATGLREKYYIIFGKFGILSWRKLKKALGR